LLLGFFFITAGMALDTGVILHQRWKIAPLAVALLAIKTLRIFVSAPTLKTGSRNVLQMDVRLSQGSELAFVIFAIPAVQQALGAEYSPVLIISVAASIALTRALVDTGRWLARKWADEDWHAVAYEQGSGTAGEAQVIIVGMGEAGRRVASALDAGDISHRAI
jgi:Kef-type K+ transport system membrane component KefB